MFGKIPLRNSMVLDFHLLEIFVLFVSDLVLLVIIGLFKFSVLSWFSFDSSFFGDLSIYSKLANLLANFSNILLELFVFLGCWLLCLFYPFWFCSFESWLEFYQFCLSFHGTHPCFCWSVLLFLIFSIQFISGNTLISFLSWFWFCWLFFI